jgi:hypothetical protein
LQLLPHYLLAKALKKNERGLATFIPSIPIDPSFEDNKLLTVDIAHQAEAYRKNLKIRKLCPNTFSWKYPTWQWNTK